MMKKGILLIIILLLILSCTKDENPESSCSSNDWEFYHINPDLQDFFFRKGSFWIFQNDSTKQTDSLYVSDIQTGCEAIYLYQGFGYNWEYYQIFYESTTVGDKYYDMIEHDMMQRNRHPSTYPSIQGWILYSSFADTSNHYLPARIDSMTVNGTSYFNVQLSHDMVTAEKTDIYMAKGVGIIKKIIYSGNNKGEWNLIRFKIIK